jgi:Amt family ammonium transporter
MSSLTAAQIEALIAVQSQKAGDTAWILVSTALVFWMSPGLSLFYGGLVHRRNVINTMQMSFVSIAVLSVMWFVCGYSFSFGPGDAFLGDGSYAALNNVTEEPNPAYSATIPHMAFMIYQMMFAIITPALIAGAVVERMSFRAYMIFIVLWSLVVYYPVAHWSWSAWYDGSGNLELGWLRKFGVLDFAGGNVVHAISGWAALVVAYFVGPRHGYPSQTAPAHNLPTVVLGTAMLWVGWYGFNGGSALAANGLAAAAFVNTHLSSASAFFTWTILESLVSKPSIAGACTGAVVGLVTITPGAGFVKPYAAVIFGIIGTLVSFTAIFLKHKYLGNDSFIGKVVTSIDDSLDAFACHGLGGFAGSILTGFFSTTEINPAGANGAFYGNPKQIYIQLASTIACIAWSCVVSAFLMVILKYTVGLRVPVAMESEGMDVGEHGEVAYHLVNTELLLENLQRSNNTAQYADKQEPENSKKSK